MNKHIKSFAPWAYLIKFSDDVFSIPKHEWAHNRHTLMVQHYVARTVPGLFETFAKSKRDSILDIGCNCGWFSFLMREQGYNNIKGIDISKRNIAQANAALNIKGYDGISFDCLSVFDVAKNNDVYDIVLCMGVLNHINNPVEFLRSLYDVTGKYLFIDCYFRADSAGNAKGGDFLGLGGGMTVGFENSGSHKQPDEYAMVYQYSKAALLSLLQHAGFNNIMEVSPRIAEPEQYRTDRSFFVAEKSADRNGWVRELRICESYASAGGMEFINGKDPFSVEAAVGNALELTGSPRYANDYHLSHYYRSQALEFAAKPIALWMEADCAQNFSACFSASNVAAVFCTDEDFDFCRKLYGAAVTNPNSVGPVPLFICSKHKRDVVTRFRLYHPNWICII